MEVVEPDADAGTRPSRTVSRAGAVHVHHHIAVLVVHEVHDVRRLWISRCSVYYLIYDMNNTKMADVWVDTIHWIPEVGGSRLQRRLSSTDMYGKTTGDE